MSRGCKHLKRVLLCACILIFLCVGIAITIALLRPISGQYASTMLIAHAGGAIDGHIYTNSKEAVLNSIRNGSKYIELDFSLTSDSELVCVHRWENVYADSCHRPQYPMSKKDFTDLRLYGKYTTLTAEDVATLMDSLSFILVTDNITNPELLDRYFARHRHRMMVECWFAEEYENLKSAGYTPMLNINRYNKNWIYKQFLLKCLHINGEWPYHWMTIEYGKENMYMLRLFKRVLGVKFAMYTCNDSDYRYKYLGREVDLIYHDD